MNPNIHTIKQSMQRKQMDPHPPPHLIVRVKTSMAIATW
jgi:hypothetical protein